MTIDIFLYMILRPLPSETSHYLNKHVAPFATTHKHHFSVKQCEALEIALDITKVHNYCITCIVSCLAGIFLKL